MARVHVLAALRADITSVRLQSIPPHLATAAGAATITSAEVIAALQTYPPDTSPGIERIPQSPCPTGVLM
jgi:hypothetical protein